MDNFLAKMETFDDSENPFINRTLILNCKTLDEYTKVCKRFPLLMSKYGNYIRHCMYYVHHEVRESFKNIPLLFQLKNLRTLTLYCVDWYKESIRSTLKQWKERRGTACPPINKLTTLNLMGDRGHTVLKSLMLGHGQQIRRYHCWGHNLEGDYAKKFAQNLSMTLPNIEELKVCDVSGALLSALSKGTWNLKRFAVRISQRDETNGLHGFLRVLNSFRNTLESVYLQLDSRKFDEKTFRSNLSFSNVTDLRVPYYLLSGKATNLVRFAKMFQNVKHLQLVDMRDWYGNDCGEEDAHIYKTPIHEIINSLWERLPPTLEVMSVRSRKKDENKNIPVVWKYRKSGIQQESDLPTSNTNF